MERLNIGVIGTGRIGRLHARNLALRIPDANVVAVADVNKKAAEQCGDELGIPWVFDNPEGLLSDPSVDAVLICSSTDTHAPLIKAAASAGKHIFCEKPIALDLKVIDRALDAVKRAGVRLQVGFNRRFDPNFHTARQAVAEGKIGKPHMLRITSRDPGPPPMEYVKVSGGLFLDMTIHDFDMARFMMGEEVTEVFAAGSVLVDRRIGRADDVDTAAVTLRFKSGAIGVIDNSRKAVYGYDQRLEVFGEKGMISAYNPRPNTTLKTNGEGSHAPPLLHFFVERYTDSYVAELSAFVKAIRDSTETPVTGLDGKIPVVMGQAADRSRRENRPVRLAEIDPSLKL